MRVLVLADNPLSTALGDGLRAFGLLKPLAARHRFDLLAFARPGERPDARAEEVFRSISLLPFPAARGAGVRRWLRALSVHAFRAESDAMKAAVAQRLASGAIDLVLDVAANMLLNLPRGPLPVPLVVDSIDEALLRDLRDLGAARWRDRPRLARQAWMFWRYERTTMARATANVYVAEPDAATYRRFFPGRPACVVPNGVDTNRFAPLDIPAEPATVAFEGNMMFGPNVDAACRLAREVLPLVQKVRPDARALLIGRNPSDTVRALQAKDVMVTGTVDDVRPHLARATVFACPMRTGSGIKNKILQAWAMARPVVATSASLGGLAARDGENLLVRDEPQEFAAAVVDLIRDADLARRLGSAGRRTVEGEYAWEQRAAQFEAVLIDALQRHARATGAPTAASRRRVTPALATTEDAWRKR